MLVTSLRDGTNLVALEFVCCRHREDARCVLSEFAGASDGLGSVFLVNPNDAGTVKGQGHATSKESITRPCAQRN